MSNRTRTHPVPVPILDGGVGLATGLDMVDDDAVLLRRGADGVQRVPSVSETPPARGRGADAPRAGYAVTGLGIEMAGRFVVVVSRQRRRSLSAPQPVRPAGVRAGGESESDRPRPEVPGESMNEPDTSHSR